MAEDEMEVDAPSAVDKGKEKAVEKKKKFEVKKVCFFLHIYALEVIGCLHLRELEADQILR